LTAATWTAGTLMADIWMAGIWMADIWMADIWKADFLAGHQSQTFFAKYPNFLAAVISIIRTLIVRYNFDCTLRIHGI
jgi:hypothetical protein